MRYHLSAPSSLAATFEPKALDDEALEFPNCDEVPMTWEQLQTYDGRIEYWDAALSTAWVLRDGAGIRHEVPCSVLGELLSRMALERGARIRCFGHAFLMVRDKDGKPRKIMCADQTVYLDPKPFQHTTDSDAVVIGSDRLPDVVLEVDHTTDVRRGKLKLYASWGFPEVWVETPDAPSRSRPRAVRPGLTIYVLEEGGYRESPESLAFPGWRAASIHMALNEEELSAATLKELARLGRVLGREGGTGPDDDPQLGGHRRWAHRRGLMAGLAEGREQGVAEGHAQGVAEGRAQMIAEQSNPLRKAAERKFGADVANQLVSLLQVSADSERLAQAWGWIIDCGDGEELLGRLAAWRDGG